MHSDNDSFHRNVVPPAELPFGWDAGELGPDGLVTIGPALDFTPRDADHFDTAAGLLVCAAQAEATRAGHPLEVTFFAISDDDEWSSFVAISVEPDQGGEERIATFVADNDDLDPAFTAGLEARGWDWLAPGNWGKGWNAATDLTDIATEVARLAREAFDPDGTAEWQFGAPVLAIDSDSGMADVIGEAAPAVARHAVLTTHGTVPDDPGRRRAACAELGLDSAEVFGG